MIKRHCFLFLLLISFSLNLFANTIPVANEIIKFGGNLQQPSAVAIAEDGRVYVLDGTQNQVVVFSKHGRVLTQFGSTGKNSLNKPMDLSLFANQIVIADTGSRRLMLYDLKGTFLKSIRFNNPTNEKLKPPVPVSVFIDERHIYWGDRPNHRVCKLERKTGILLKCFGKRGETDGLFQFPWQIDADRDGYLHVVDVLNGRVQTFHKTGQFFSQTSRFGLGEGELYRPNGIAIDDEDTVFVSDSYFGTISLFRNQKYARPLTLKNGSLLQFKVPVGLALYQHYLFVVDAKANALYRISLEAVEEKALPAQAVLNKTASVSQKNCVTCHLSWAKEKHLKTQQYSQEILPVASVEMCYSCHHGVVLDSRLMIGHNGQHPSIYDPENDKLSLAQMNKRQDKMPKEFPLTKNKEMLCSSCHTPHNSDEGADTLYVGHQNSWMRVSSKDGDLCERCHESKTKNARQLDKKKRGINHPLGIKLAPPPQPNQQGYATEKKLQESGLPLALKKNLASLNSQNELICQSCHQVHGGKDTELLTITQKKGALCVQCHAKQHSIDDKEARKKGIHPVNVKLEKPITRAGKKIETVTCASCHKVHNGTLGTDLLPNNIKESEALCIDCHERQHAKDDKEALKKGVHPTNKKLDEVVTIGNKKIHKLACLSCHSIHDGEPNTEALLAPNKRDEFCKNCHEGYFAKDEKEALAKGLHPTHLKMEEAVEIGENKVKQLGCSACHSMHKGEPNTLALLETNKDDAFCKNCHKKYFAKDEKEALEKGLHPTHMTMEESVKIGDHEFKTLGCLNCHSMHQGKVKTLALVEDNKDDALCKNCHKKYFAKDEKEALEKGLHPTHITMEESVKIGDHEFKTLSCLNCHSMHQGKVKTLALIEDNQGDALCKNCHKKYFAKNEKEALAKGLHPTHLKMDKAVKIGDHKFKQLGCLSCHSVHQGKVKTLALVEDNQGDALCKNCHKKYFAKDKKEALAKGLHPTHLEMDEAVKIGDHEFKQLGCLSCHSVHQGKVKTLALVEDNQGDALCKNCHKDYFAKNQKEGHEKGIHPSHQEMEETVKIGDKKTNQLGCLVCHSVHQGKVKTLALVEHNKEDALCKNCHKNYFAKDKEDGFKKGIHPTHQKLEELVKIGDKDIKKLSCLGCHSVHQGKVETSVLLEINENDAMCEKCHENYFAKDKDDALKKGIHPMNDKLDEVVKIAGKEVLQMGCLSCHGVHSGGIKETPALLEGFKEGELCQNCHEYKRPIAGTDHHFRITAKDKKNHFDELPAESGVCGTCHTMHRGDGKLPHLFAAKIIKLNQKDTGEQLFVEDALCLNCHQEKGMGEKKEIKYFTHPSRDLILRSDEKVMPLLDKDEKISEFGAIACITCHEPHLWQPLSVDNDPKASGNQNNLEGTIKNSYLRNLGVIDTFCIDCHSVDALPKYKYYHDKDRVRNIGVDYIR